MTIALQPRSFLDVDGLRVAYRQGGEDHPGTPVILLHGWGASLDAVASIQACLEVEHHVVAIDLPGFGQTPLPSTVWGSPDYALFVKRTLELLGLHRVSLVGHSFGGKLSILLATRWPALVDRLVLVDSAGIRPRRSPLYRLRVAAYRTARRLAGPGPAADWLSRRFGSADYRAAGPLRATLVRVVNEDLRRLLPHVEAPTLIVWGDRDRETPLSDGRLMEQLIPDSGLVVFPGAGHYAYADDPNRFCRVVANFLKT